MEWYEGDFNDFEGALIRTESEPPVFGDEGQREDDMKVKIDGKVYDTTKAEVIATYDSGLPRMDLDYIREGLYKQGNDTQRQPSSNSGGLDMTQSTNSPLAADSKS